MSDLDTPMIFRELTGQRRTVRLVSRAKPYRGLGFGVKQRVHTTWLPGAPVATQTVLGLELAPTTFNGKWKTKYLDNINGGEVAFAVDSRPVRTAEAAVATFKSICSEGQLVEFTWGRELLRGILAEFNWTYDNRRDIEWNFKIEWQSQGTAQPPAVLSEDASLTSIGPRLRRRAERAEEVASDPPYAIVADTLSDIQQVTARIASLTQDVLDTAALGATLALTPIEVLTRGAALLDGAINATGELLDLILTTPSASMFDGVATTAQLASIDRWRWSQMSFGNTMRRDCADQKAQLVATLGDDLLAVHTARAGEDLRDVALTYYGTRDAWRALMAFNNLRTSALTGGQVVLIPNSTDGIGTRRRGSL